MRKELPLVDPPYKHLLRVAYRTSILLTIKNVDSWCYSNYIQLTCDSKNKETRLLFTYVPFITEVRKVVKTAKKESKTYINKVIKEINKGIYVMLGLDEYYIPSRPIFFNKKHFKHDVLVYGYDLEKQEFLIQGYADRDIYENSTLKFVDFEKAFTYYSKTHWVSYYKHSKKLYTYQKKNNKRFNEKLYCHYKSIYPLRLRLFSARNFCIGMSFGMKVYDLFKELLSEQVALGEYNPSVLRGLLSISEQKHCIAMGYKYLDNKEIDLTEYIDFFENLSNEYLKLRNLELKFKFNQNPDTAKKIIDRMDQLIEEENNILKNYFNIVGSPFGFY